MSDWFVTNYHYLQEFGLISLQWLLSLSQYFGSNMTSICWQAQTYDNYGFPRRRIEHMLFMYWNMDASMLWSMNPFYSYNTSIMYITLA